MTSRRRTRSFLPMAAVVLFALPAFAAEVPDQLPEGTEAYFYRNDFYPFVRAELKEHDPVLHDLLEEIWGPLK